MLLVLFLLVSSISISPAAAARQLHLQGQLLEGYHVTPSSSSSSSSSKRVLQQQQQPQAQQQQQQTPSQQQQQQPQLQPQQQQPLDKASTAQLGVPIYITLEPPLNNTASPDPKPKTPGAALPPVPDPPPPPEAPWQQRRTLQLPPHVYLISFVMLLAIMAGLLSCHCYRMCRIARRMRQAAELGVTVSAAGSMLSKRTPQSVIEALPVSKYSSIQNQRQAKSAHCLGKAAAAAGEHAGGGACATESGSSNAFVAAAVQLRDQLARQSGISRLSFSRSNNNSSSNTTAACTAATSSIAGSVGAEIVPAGDRAGAIAIQHAAAAAAADAAKSQQEGKVDGAAPDAVSASTSDQNAGPAAPAAPTEAAALPMAAVLTAPPAAATLGMSSCNEATITSTTAAAAAAVAAAATGANPKALGSGLSSSNGAEPCAICFEDFADNDDVKRLPCHHFYHCSCIDEWLVRDVTCPLCKAPVLDQALLEQQQRVAAALEASFGNMSPALRRQQLMLRARDRSIRERSLSGRGGGIDAGAGEAADVAGASGQQQAQQLAAAAAAAAAPGRRSRSSAARELLELAGLSMLSFPGRRGTSISRSRSGSTTQQQQQQLQQQAAADVEVGVSGTHRS